MNNLTFVSLVGLAVLGSVGFMIRDRARDRAMVSFGSSCLRVVHNANEMKAHRICGPSLDDIEPVRRGDLPKNNSWRHDYEVDPKEIVLSLDQMNNVRGLLPDEESSWDDSEDSGRHLALTSSFAIEMFAVEGHLIAILENGRDRIYLVSESGDVLGVAMVDALQMERWNSIYNELWACA